MGRPASRAPTTAGAAAPSTLLVAIALGGLVLAAYAPTLRAGFIWDDDAYVTNNQALRTFDGLGRIWLSPGATPQYYPLTFTSFWIEHQIFGDRPFGYHLTNVALHGLNAILVWLVLARLAMPGAWLAAAVFAVHPVHVESVAWITERKNLLSGALYLTALLLAVAPAGSPSIAERREHRWLVVAAFVGALLAKTVTCTLPVVLLLLLWGGTGGSRAATSSPPCPSSPSAVSSRWSRSGWSART